jgi:hypothetical protein
MKASAVRRRSKAQIIEDKMQDSKKRRDIEEKLQQWQQMEAALEAAQDKIRETEVVHEHVQGMFNDGLLKINNDGGYLVVDDPAERSKLKQDNLNQSKQHHQSQSDAQSQQQQEFQQDILDQSQADNGGMMQS